MKTKKLNLNDLKVESFTTSVKNIEAINVNTLKGGNGGGSTVLLPGNSNFGCMTMCCTWLPGQCH